MSAGSFVPAVLFAGTVLLALEPIRRPRALAVTSYLAGLGASELPQLFLVLVLTATVPTIAENGLPDGPAGWAFLGLAALTCAGLGAVARRSWRARDVVGRALAEGLGDRTGYRRPSLSRVLHVLLAPFPVHPRRVERIPDVSYGDAGRRNRLDVYRLRSRPAGAPVLVYLHGGGYFSGTKRREARALLHRMAADGWVCVSANYRLRPAAGFVDHLVDVKKVLAWVREHGPAYGADPGTVVVSGSSAGGHLAALAALTPGEPVYQPGFEHVDTSVSAAVCLYGYYGAYYGHPEDERPSSSPLVLDASHAPPFFLAHGDRDTYLPVEGARAFAARLRRSSPSPVVYAELPGGQHGFDRFRSLRFEAVVDGVAAFLARVGDRAARVPGRP
ncbi:MAG TPA: alpha/beta hydrolase [Streptomyces sp.]|uniref:alpha/beta hydrolase n=1 Tax=Streptomyces sp. TaxID=1931 RepID=UPI002C6E4B1B|nr:alpha/beta hydrolase [Streptomyces sp.]HWU11742.1 alpha/beta hydrolase [Streptomyces sp.]